MIKACLNCNKEFNVKPYLMEKAKYCSRQCVRSHKSEIKKCLNCNKEFHVKRCVIKRAKYCSKKCCAIHKTDRNEFKCLNCGIKFERWKSKGIRKFCSNECAFTYRRKAIPEISKNGFYTGYVCNIKTGCWNWIKAKNKKRYGIVRYYEKNYIAHRLSWILHNGDIPNGLMVCHRKDNPSCVNPAHLFLGTAQDNSTDMVNKGRNKKHI